MSGLGKKKLKKKKKKDQPTDPPNFHAKRANKPFIFLDLSLCEKGMTCSKNLFAEPEKQIRRYNYSPLCVMSKWREAADSPFLTSLVSIHILLSVSTFCICLGGTQI